MARNRRAIISAIDRTVGGSFAAAFVLGAAVLTALSVPSHAQDGRPEDVGKRLESVREALDRDRAASETLAREAEAQANELAALRAELRAAARAVQSHEAALDGLEAELATLGADAVRMQGELETRRAQLGATLAALQRLSLRPTAALLVSPGDPNDVVRSGLLLRTAVPEIEVQARRLRADIEELAEVRRQIETRRGELHAAALDLGRERDRLSALSAEKDRVLNQTRRAQSEVEERAAVLSREARTLEELLSRLRENAAAVPRPRPGAPEADFVKPTLAPSGPSIAAARGQLSPPAYGTVIRGFGTQTETGGITRGVTYRTRSEASVVAPWDGRIAFSGPFRRFGQILIIDHGEGYHSLIAGLGRIDAQVGQWVLAGEPVGRAEGSADSKADTVRGSENGGQAGTAEDRAGGAILYVELRRNGEPINPLPWLAAQTNRTQG
jgi:septal ring factor EnvC (AmiA/AmiB activator)